MSTLTYKSLQQKNPQWDGAYWQRTRALYAGGKTLLGNSTLMRSIFPPHLAEDPRVYEERIKRAYYIPYAGEIIDMITSSLFYEDIAVNSLGPVSDWFNTWAYDVSPPGGSRQSLRQFLKHQVTTALLCKRAWTLIDMPVAPEADVAPLSLLEQEESGGLQVYACPLDPESVLDWEVDQDGKLLWVLVHYTHRRRKTLQNNRDQVTEEWVLYDRHTWSKYRITYDHRKPPADTTVIPLAEQGEHSFGEVPVIPFDLPDGLWAMGKVESIAVAHFNKRNALSWAEYKSLFPVMAHFAAPLDPMNSASEDPDRAVNQTMGQGHVLQFAQGDEFKFIGPETNAFAVAQMDLKDLRDEMHRVLHQMALSVDNTGAALQRSAESKEVDRASSAIVLKEFGKLVREHAVLMYRLAQRGRGEQETIWVALGMDNYDDAGAEAAVAQAQALEDIPIPSATFQRTFKMHLVKRVLGQSASVEILETIREELESNITNEQFGELPADYMYRQIDGQAVTDNEDDSAKNTPNEMSGKAKNKPTKQKTKPGKVAPGSERRPKPNVDQVDAQKVKRE